MVYLISRKRAAVDGMLLLLLWALGQASLTDAVTPPNIYDWLQENIYICKYLDVKLFHVVNHDETMLDVSMRRIVEGDLDPTFGRTRFLSADEAVFFRCRCGDPMVILSSSTVKKTVS